MAEPPTWAIVADYATRLGEAEKQAKKQAVDTHRWWINYLVLRPFAVHVEYSPIEIPLQRTAPRNEVDLWPPAVVLPEKRIWYPTETPRRNRFLDSRNSPTP